MTRSISGYLKHTKDVRSVRQIHAITTAIVEDPHSSPRLKERSAALTRKLERVLNLPIASAPFLASIWRDFRTLSELLACEDERVNGPTSKCHGRTSGKSCNPAIKEARIALSKGRRFATEGSNQAAAATLKLRDDQLR